MIKLRLRVKENRINKKPTRDIVDGFVLTFPRVSHVENGDFLRFIKAIVVCVIFLLF